MNVFVSGGSRGIGREIVIRFARAGWGVAFSYTEYEEGAKETVRMAENAIRDSGTVGPASDSPKIKYYRLDLRERGSIESVCDQIFSDFSEMHALVNNAATLRNNFAVMMSDEDWDDVIAVNLTGPFMLMRTFTMHFVGNRFGRIVNISSLAENGCSGQANYAASKAGLFGLTLTFAKEYGPKGVTANIVSLGFVPTDMTKNNMADALEKYWLQYCPLRRAAKGSEVADFVHFLCSESGGFINGERIRLDGGLSYVL
jgi:3-oxoacyl-[acyl-carrier protein] reductase